MRKWTKKDKELFAELWYVKELPMVVVANNLGRTANACYEYIYKHELKSRRKGEGIKDEVARLTKEGLQPLAISKILGISRYHVIKARDMAKVVKLFESVTGDLFDTEEEADERDALDALQDAFKASTGFILSDDQLDILHEVVSNPDIARALSVYAKQRKAVEEMREKQNERPADIAEVLSGKDNIS